MTVKDLVYEIRQLPLNERLELLEAVTHSVREEIEFTRPAGPSLDRVLGMLRPDGPLPTDQELKDDYINYLVEKYS